LSHFLAKKDGHDNVVLYNHIFSLSAVSATFQVVQEVGKFLLDSKKQKSKVQHIFLYM
jgi:hypothetical protein